MACIDTPQLDRMKLTLFNQIDFDFPRLAQFINITPTLRASDEAHVIFHDSVANVILKCTTSNDLDGYLERTVPPDVESGIAFAVDRVRDNLSAFAQIRGAPMRGSSFARKSRSSASNPDRPPLV